MNFPADAKKIKIIFICDACGEDVIVEEVAVPENGSVEITATCPVCFKEFAVTITPGNVEIPAAEDIKITVL